MKRNLIRAAQFAVCLAAGFAATLPSVASPADSQVSTSAATSAVMAAVDYQPAPSRIQTSLQAEDCSHVTHQNFCYCTDAPCHDEVSR